MAMISCKKCGKEISGKAKTCPNCGSPLSPNGIIKIEHRTHVDYSKRYRQTLIKTKLCRRHRKAEIPTSAKICPKCHKKSSKYTGFKIVAFLFFSFLAYSFISQRNMVGGENNIYFGIACLTISAFLFISLFTGNKFYKKKEQSFRPQSTPVPSKGAIDQPRSKVPATIIPNNDTLSTSKDVFLSIPQEILELLYIKGGPLSNYTDSLENEPSLIDTSLEISSDVFDAEKYVDIGYYPSYKGLSPKHRYIYLNWLKDITSEIATGYVFIFYYGLERQLVYGKYEQAYAMISNLRKYHKNGSFLAYSNDALLLSAIHYKDTKRLHCIDIAGFNWELRILIDYLQGKPIGIEHIIGIHRKTGFVNDRYLKICPDLFIETLCKNLIEKYGSQHIPLRDSDFQNSKQNCLLAIANYSLQPEQRFTSAPDITSTALLK